MEPSGSSQQLDAKLQAKDGDGRGNNMKHSACNHGVRSILLALVGAVGLASPAAVFAEPVGPSPKITGAIGFGKLVVSEAGNISYPILNHGSTPLKMTYTFTKWNGSTWNAFHSNTTVIPAKGSLTVGATVGRTKDVQKVRLDITATGHASVAQEITIGAKKLYVVRYKTNGWVQIDYQYQRTTKELIGQGVNDKMAEAKAFGFATKRKTDETTYVVGANAYRTYAYAKADNWHERAFNTKAEQDAFQRQILRVVPSYTNDGPGLNTQLVTR
jgi:hypothetical protein